jgi:hypothetical protein
LAARTAKSELDRYYIFIVVTEPAPAQMLAPEESVLSRVRSRERHGVGRHFY